MLKIDLLEKSNIPYFEASARDDPNIEKAFETVVRKMFSRISDSAYRCFVVEVEINHFIFFENQMQL